MSSGLISEALEYIRGDNAELQLAEVHITKDLFAFKSQILEQDGSSHFGYSLGPRENRSLAVLEAFERFIALKHIKNTSGCALHSSSQAAMIAARAELIERHVVLKAWFNGTPPKAIPLEIDAETKLEVLNQAGFKVRVCSFGRFCETAITSVIIFNPKHKAMSFGAAARGSVHLSVEKAFDEAFTVWAMDFHAQEERYLIPSNTQRSLFSGKENWDKMQNFFFDVAGEEISIFEEPKVTYQNLSERENLKLIHVYQASCTEMISPSKISATFHPYSA